MPTPAPNPALMAEALRAILQQVIQGPVLERDACIADARRALGLIPNPSPVRAVPPHAFEAFEGEDANDPRTWCRHCNSTRAEHGLNAAGFWTPPGPLATALTAAIGSMAETIDYAFENGTEDEGIEDETIADTFRPVVDAIWRAEAAKREQDANPNGTGPDRYSESA